MEIIKINELNNCKCKYVTPDSIFVYCAVRTLYDILEKHNGGLAHIVVDENNLDDDSIKCVLEECNKEENKHRDDTYICKVLCESLLRLTYEQRCFTFAFIESDEDRSIDLLAALAHNYCAMGRVDSCNKFCNLKWDLNRFCAEKKCIKETGSNEKFLNHEWPIEEV